MSHVKRFCNVYTRVVYTNCFAITLNTITIMFAFIKSTTNDLLYITSIARLGRNYQEILEQWRILTKEKKVDIVVMDMPLLDTRRGKDLMGAFLSDIVLALLSYVAENERKNIKSRQREGIEAAKLRGVRFGRPNVQLPDNFTLVYRRWANKEISGERAAEICNISPSTFYRRARKIKSQG